MVKKAIKIFLHMFCAFLALLNWEIIFCFCWFPHSHSTFKSLPHVCSKSLAMSYFLMERRCSFSLLWQTWAFLWNEQVMDKRGQVSVSQFNMLPNSGSAAPSSKASIWETSVDRKKVSVALLRRLTTWGEGRLLSKGWLCLIAQREEFLKGNFRGT